MKMNRIFTLLTVAALIVAMAGCSHTRITSTWHDVNEPPKKMEKIGVVVMASSKANRGMIETAIVNEFAKYNITAVSTMGIFPRAGEDLGEISREEIEKVVKEKVAANGLDGLMMVTLMDVKEDQYYVEGSATYNTSPYYGGYGGAYHYPISSYPNYNYGYAGYYSYAYSTVYSPGYYVNTTSYFIETTLFDTKSEKMLWTGQTETTDPSSVSKESGFFAELIVTQILADRAIEP